MKSIKIQYFKTALGELLMGSYEEQLCLCDWRYRKMRSAIDQRIKTGLDAEYIEEETDIIHQTKNQLTEYFNGLRTTFDIPLLLVGTSFQKSVWEELMKIPFGKTETYLGLAKTMNNKLAIRAVAAANGANAISIMVPCHRIIGSKGELIGYAGGLSVKKKLLKLEGSDPLGDQLELF